MSERKMKWMVSGVLGMAMLAAACGNAQKEATAAAIAAAQSAITAAQGEAAKYAPDQLKAAQDAVQSAKDALAKDDYEAALKGAQDAAAKAKDLAAAAAAKKDELMKGWNSLNASIPKQMQEVKAKLDAYSHGAKMPAGMDKIKLADAKTQYEQLKQGMADATASFNQGNLADATNRASGLQDLLAKLMEMLGIKS
jgi:hypothetical protein